MRNIIRSVTCAMFFALPPGLVSAEDGLGPLEKVAAVFPLFNDEVFVTLLDIEASARQIARINEPDQVLRDFASFWSLPHLEGFGIYARRQLEDSLLDGYRPALGFSIFDIGQIAGVSSREGAVSFVMKGPEFAGSAGRINEALSARNFMHEDRGDIQVWSRMDDGTFDMARRNEDPFAGSLGHSERFALKNDTMFFARTWPVLDRLLADGPTLLDDKDAAAILRSGYLLSEKGALLDAILFKQQPSFYEAIIGRSAAQMDMSDEDLNALATMWNSDLSAFGMPPFQRYGLLLWQDGDLMTGALALPYADAQTATLAKARFGAILDRIVAPKLVQSVEALPYLMEAERDFRVVDADGRSVLVLAFSQRVPAANGIDLGVLGNTPQIQLLSMALRGEIGLLIGGI